MLAPINHADDRPLLLDPIADGPPQGRSHWWAELLVIAWLCWAYDAISNLAALRQAAAFAHARSVLHLEHLLHLDPELTLNHWLSDHHTLALVASEYYDNAHFVVTLALVGWLWWRHPDIYRPLRTSLVLINVIGFLVFWRYPMAPPRMLANPHFADIVAGTNAVGAWHSGSLASHANQLAAMPSLHMAWATWCGLALWRVFRHRRGAAVAWVYPLLTAVVVVATGNHFVTDLVAGVATTIVASFAADQLHWRWASHRGHRRSSSTAEQHGDQVPAAA